MSTDYFMYCDTCKKCDDNIFASSSISYGFKIWRDDLDKTQIFLREHEGHDVKLISEHSSVFEALDD